MVEILKSNWFVVLIAIIILSFVVYYVYDENKYNVSGKTVDGQELLASCAGKNITADDFYEEEQNFNQSLIYSMYKIAVLNESIEETDEMKSDAKELETNIRTNFESSYGENYKITLNQSLANYGFTGDDALYDYCIAAEKEKALFKNYISDNFDTYKEGVEAKSPRLVSIISMAVEDAENLTDEEKEKKENIEKEIKDESFGKAATEFSEDTSTASEEGFFGYIDEDQTSNSAASSSSVTIDGSVVEAAIALKKGETSDWVTVTNSSGTTYLYKVHVDETDLNEIFNSSKEDVQEDVINAFISANNTLQYDAIVDAASKLDITFTDDETKEKLESYIASLTEDEEVSE